MKSQSWHLTTPQVRGNCIAFISNLPTDENFVVTIKTEHESRSDAQSRLRWLWMAQLEKELAGKGKGRDRMQWNLFFKHRFMCQILIAQDEDYQKFFDDYHETCDLLRGNKKLLENYQCDFWEHIARTDMFKVKSMAEWLLCIDKYCIEELHITLKTPDELINIIKG